ncbi:hypothetical protein [Flavobacterium sp. RSSB_23]|uniref:hypothetical protein n=1 Tax=Flavobacterium sp. RSSB_23 TaxID=3447668 RepID=UPI003F35412C
MIRRITEIFLITITQIFCLVFIFEIINYCFPMQHKEVGFGITVNYFFYILSLSLLACNYYVEFFIKRKILLILALLLITIILPFEALSFRPLKSILLIILSTFGFLSTVLISKWRKRNKLQKVEEYRIERKSEFHKKIENYFDKLADNRIPKTLMQELINRITDTEYENYKRFWNQYPKSRKRYSKLKIEDLNHPFINYLITDYFKQNDFENYKKYSLILLKMITEEFEQYEISKYQYETK